MLQCRFAVMLLVGTACCGCAGTGWGGRVMNRVGAPSFSAVPVAEVRVETVPPPGAIALADVEGVQGGIMFSATDDARARCGEVGGDVFVVESTGTTTAFPLTLDVVRGTAYRVRP